MIAVLDAGIVMNTSLLPKIQTDMAIPTSVVEEIKSNKAKHIFDLLQSEYNLTIVDPLPKYIGIVKENARKLGQNRLSDQDIDVLAVALMMQDHDDVVIYSDDYGLRNVSHELGIRSRGVTTTGGQEKRSYGFRCQACGHIYSEIVPDCDICGHDQFQRFRT